MNAADTAFLADRALAIKPSPSMAAKTRVDQLRAQGRDALDQWFLSSAELDPAFVREAEAALDTHPASADAGPSQSDALRFVRTYEDLVGCDDGSSHARECARASQLKSFLESSTTLIVRQRVRDIWQTECASLEPASVLDWIREFPTPQPTLGRAEWAQVVRAGYDKLVTCHLADPAGGASYFPDWLTRHLPSPSDVTSRGLNHLDELRALWSPDGPEARCLRAAQTLRTLAPPTECALGPVVRNTLTSWFEQSATLDRTSEDLSLRACTAYVETTWHAHGVRVIESFPGEPSPDELIHVDNDSAPPALIALRSACTRRLGSIAQFPVNLRALARVAEAAHDDISALPWNLDPAGTRPEEAARAERAQQLETWARSMASGVDACAALAFAPARCHTCTTAAAAGRYDCALLVNVQTRWSFWKRLVGGTLLAFVFGIVATRWGLSLRRSVRTLGAWRRETVGHLRRIGLAVHSDPLRFVFPARMQTVRLDLPGGAWERWGSTMAIVHAERDDQITERDVQRAALAARAEDGEIAVVTHDEGASPNLASVRAMLDWAARGPKGAVQILPVSSTRLQWANSTDDLLDLVEQVSLRGNPFEVRGRLVSSSQFFNRERLVSGLLAAMQAGSWTVVTGLRRFGKSSLALEVARKLQAPYAYVDLAGFHHEITSSGVDPLRSVDAIVRYMMRQLHASATTVFGKDVVLPEPPSESASIDTDALTSWTREFLAACRVAKNGRAVTPLVIFDELEQAIGVGTEKVGNAINVLSILLGRLRASFTDALATQGSDRVGGLFCSAIHAALWAPLTTLGRQSFLGAFASVSVPRLPEDAAFAMMRGLGARQGIRFTDQALALIVREAQGIPILVRRIGSSVLELYDPERARQGSLGAVEIGVEGAAAAVRREEEDGAPLRVWVESEIGDVHSPVGGLLRLLARKGTVSIDELKKHAFEAVTVQFEALGLTKVLGAEESRRRALEAAGFVVRMLDEIGILVPEGDMTGPTAFTFPDSVVRRVLASDPGRSVFGF